MKVGGPQVLDHFLGPVDRMDQSTVRHRFESPDGWELCTHCHSIRRSDLHHDLPEGWEPIETAPRNATEVEVMMVDGTTQTAHWAQDLSGEDCPPFKGWFVKAGTGRNTYFRSIDTPNGWRPKKKLHACGDPDCIVPHPAAHKRKPV
jgi:hypothetical protein